MFFHKVLTIITGPGPQSGSGRSLTLLLFLPLGKLQTALPLSWLVSFYILTTYRCITTTGGRKGSNTPLSLCLRIDLKKRLPVSLWCLKTETVSAGTGWASADGSVSKCLGQKGPQTRSEHGVSTRSAWLVWAVPMGLDTLWSAPTPEPIPLTRVVWALLPSHTLEKDVWF